MKIELYADLVSQPSRAVYWLCLLNGINVDVKTVQLAKGEHRTSEYLAISPNGKVPTLRVLADNDGTGRDFVLFESHAILRYLARKFHLDRSWYPENDDAEQTGRIDSYLDAWHHTMLRFFIARMVRQRYLVPLVWNNNPKFFEPEEQVRGYEKQTVVALQMINDYWLNKGAGRFIGPSNVMTIADLSAYEEITQAITLMPEWWDDVMQKQSMPALARWVQDMKSLPHYDTVHRVLQRVRQVRGPTPSSAGSVSRSKL